MKNPKAKKAPPKKRIKKKREKIEKAEIMDLTKNAMFLYALVAISRAIPTIQDTMNISQRRAYQIALRYRSLAKGARLVGDMLGELHPHGDTSSYGTICNMANSNFPIIRAHGNMGDVMYSDINPAAMRYTEHCISPWGIAIIDNDIKDIVPKKNTYDDTGKEYVFMPIKVPIGIINGTNGVGWGYANKVPPHQPLNVINTMIAMLKKTNLSLTKSELNKTLKTPYRRGFSDKFQKRENLYMSLANTIVNEASYTVEEGKYGAKVVTITSIPVDSTITGIIKKIKDLHESSKASPLTAISDMSGKTDICIELRLRKGTNVKSYLDVLKVKNITQSKVRYTPVYYDVMGSIIPRRYTIHDLIKAFIVNRIHYKELGVIDQIQKIEDRILLLQIRKKIISNKKVFDALIFNATTENNAKKKIMKNYDCKEEIAGKVLNTSYRLGLNKAKSLTDDINKLKKELAVYKKRKKNIKGYLVEELEELKKVVIKEYNPIRKIRYIKDINKK